MSWIGVSVLVATLGITCLAQESQPTAERASSPELRIAPDAKIRIDGNEGIAPLDQVSYLSPIYVNPDDDDTCYTMRSYLFERDGTDAPEITGETTCTPANKRAFKRVVPKARLVPAN
jgi:hypothetical protein